MSPIGNPAILTQATPPRQAEKIRGAASQFEALLIGQILRAARTASFEDPASDCATDFAEQQLAATMAEAGGLGIADMIARNFK